MSISFSPTSGSGMVAQSPPQKMVLESPTLKPGQAVPRQHTADGTNSSPELKWSNVPPGTKEFVVTCEDHDTFEPNQVPFLQWVIYGIPGTARGLPAGIPNVELITAPDEILGAIQARTAFDIPGYRGPQPLVGETHRYRFVLYALNTDLGLGPGLFANAVLTAIKPYVIAEAEIGATYERKPR